MRSILYAAACLSLATVDAASGQILNGGLETGPDPGTSVVRLSPGSTAIAGWTVLNATVDYVGPAWQASEGLRSVDLDGEVGDAGGLQQTFPTVPGLTYSVTFDLAGNPDSAPAIKQLRVSAAGQSRDFSFDITGHDRVSMGWAAQSWSFTANATATTLVFQSLTGSGYGPMLDNVKVIAPAQVDLQASITALYGGVPMNTVVPGQPVTFRIAIANLLGSTGMAATVSISGATGATLTYLPPAAAPVTCTAATPASLTCRLSAAGGDALNVSFDVQATPLAVGTLTAGVSVTANEPDINPANNQASAQVSVIPPVADVGIALALPSGTLTGKTIQITLDLFNRGPQPATGVLAVLTWSGNTGAVLALVPAAPTVTCPPNEGPFPCTVQPPPAPPCTLNGTTFTCGVSSLVPGQHFLIAFTATPASPGTLSVSVTAAANEADPSVPNVAAGQTLVSLPKADLAPAISAQSPPGTPVQTVPAGRAVMFRVVVSNLGPDPAHAVKAALTLSGGTGAALTFFSAITPMPSCVPAAGGLTCSWGPALGSADPYVVNVQATPVAPGTLTLTASVTAEEGDPNPANNTAVASVTVSPNTPTGTGVTVQLGPISLTFANVLTAGNTTVRSLTPQDPVLPALPPGFAPFRSLAFDLSTTAVASGPIDVRFNLAVLVPEDPIAPNVFSALRVLHGENGILVNRTTPPDPVAPPDPILPLFARVTSFSPFVIAQMSNKILFTSTRDGNFEIYSMNSDGTGVARLTANPAADIFPAWSPNRARIAFTSNRDGNFEIYTMNADGTSPARLTVNSRVDGAPSWSPDGNRIAFTSNRDGNLEIYVVNADGTGLTRLTAHAAADMQPAWSPDGKKIAFASARSGLFQIYSMNADGSGVVRLTNAAAIETHPCWSPNGAKILFSSNRDGIANLEIYAVPAGGGSAARLTSNPALDGEPCWSPDGAQIVFSSNRDGLLNSEIYVMNANGSGTSRLTANAAADSFPRW